MSDACKSVGIIGAAHDESLKAMVSYQAVGDARFHLFGSRAMIQNRAAELGISLGDCIIEEASDEAHACRLAAVAAQEGRLNVLMKGSVHTATFLNALLDKEFSLMPEGSLLSHVARIELPWYRKPLLLTDAAVSILPDLDKKVQIVGNAIKVARKLGIACPRVALVCPVETVNPRIVSTTDASQIVFLHRNTGVFGDAVIEGPFGLDVALSKDAAHVKEISGEVPGEADILVFGNIDAANATYKAFLSAPDVTCAGIVVGASLPVVLTSRSDSMYTRMASIELALRVSS
jgi:phosphotransacetylase